MIERFVYSPYGQSTVLDDNFATDSDGVSDVGWEYRFTSREFDNETAFRTISVLDTITTILEGSLDGIRIFTRTDTTHLLHGVVCSRKP